MAGADATRCMQCGATDAAPLFVKNGYRLVRCAGCDLAYIANPPSDADLGKLYASADDYHAPLRDPSSRAAREMTALGRQHLAFVRRHVRSGRLLDVGCSTGSFLAAAAGAGFRAEGVEFSDASAAFARAHHGLSVSVGDVRSAPEALFDVVTMFDVIEHVRDPRADLTEVSRRLAPGGLFIASTPNIDGWFPRASLKVTERIDHWPHAEPPYHLFQFSKASFARLLRSAGLEPLATQDTNMPLAYSFGAVSTLLGSPKMLAYAAAFAPLAKIAPMFGRGDWFYVAARKV
jgi:SAM-dependent methyltransferase